MTAPKQTRSTDPYAAPPYKPDPTPHRIVLGLTLLAVAAAAVTAKLLHMW